MASRMGAAALVVAMITIAGAAAAAGPAAPSGKGPPPAGPKTAPGGPSESRGDAKAVPAAPQISQDAAARARMHECAHQWAAIKKAGTAGVTTWKEFSATCLVVSR
jgi:hypothetical protein